MKYFLRIAIMTIVLPLSAQDNNLPYYEIPDYPESFTAGSVASRMVDGLGFRFYWATEGLRDEDLAFRPNPEARTSEETIAHIYGMSITILNSTTKTANVPGQNIKLPFSEMRKATLENLKAASERLRTSSDEDLKEYKMVFKRGDTTSEYPFWNQINGPIADCLWHVGQVVSFRRSAGNPINNKANVLTGKVKQ